MFNTLKLVRLYILAYIQNGKEQSFTLDTTKLGTALNV